MRGAALRSQRQVDGDVLLLAVLAGGDGIEANAVDQPQIHDIHGNLGIVTLLQGAQNVGFGDSRHEMLLNDKFTSPYDPRTEAEDSTHAGGGDPDCRRPNRLHSVRASRGSAAGGDPGAAAE